VALKQHPGTRAIEDVIAGLRVVGIDVVAGPTKRRDGASVLVHDPDGVRVELQLKNPTTNTMWPRSWLPQTMLCRR
jgi:hypothetical protein